MDLFTSSKKTSVFLFLKKKVDVNKTQLLIDLVCLAFFTWDIRLVYFCFDKKGKATHKKQLKNLLCLALFTSDSKLAYFCFDK